MSISRWVDKTALIHLHNGVWLSGKKEENYTLWDSMDEPENIMLGEIGHLEKDRYHEFTHMQNLTNKLN